MQANPQVILLECEDCKAVTASRMPTQEALDRYYGSWYQEPIHKESGEEVTFDDSARFGRHLANLVSRYQDFKRFAILDFGGGDGSLAYSLALQLLERGAERIEILVVDYNDRTVASKDPKIVVSRVATLDEVSGTYNLVIASAIIEHLTEPKQYLKKLLESLAPGGCFYARTPYIYPLMSVLAVVGLKWDFSFPGHVHDLGQEFWERYFRKSQSLQNWQVLVSRPSLVETTLRKHAVRTMIAYLLKAPWHVFGRSYKLVGGWEVFVRKGS